MPRMRALLIGAVESSRVALDALSRSADWTIAAVVTLDDALSHRHSDFVDLGGEADRLGCPVIRVGNINADIALDRIGAVDADYVFVIGWSQICGPKILDRWDGRVIGYHPAPLPRMRGRAAIPWTIMSGDAISAGTLFWIDGGTDTGAILDQQFFHVAPLETAATLYAKHMRALATMLDRSLPVLANGEAPRIPQDEECATWAARRTPQDGRIDWTCPAETVLRLIRASGRPYPGAWTEAGGASLQIWSASLCASGGRHLARAGQVIQTTAEDFTVMCGGVTALRVTEWTSPDRGPRLNAFLGD